MLEAAKSYVRRVILIHLALLLVVIALLMLGGRELYVRAREQQISDAADRQQLLARQTARGIESYYQSITQDLELIFSPDTADATQPAQTQEGIPPDEGPGMQGGPPGMGGPGMGGGPGGGQGQFGQPGQGQPGRGGRGQGAGGAPGGPGSAGPGGGQGGGPGQGPGGNQGLFPPRPDRAGAARPQRIVDRTIPASPATLRLIGLQLRRRISNLFIVDAKETTVDGVATKTANVNFFYPENTRPVAQKIADRNLQWITGLTTTEISGFITLEGGEQCHLIGVPAQRMEQQGGVARMVRCTVVAVVPVAYIKEDLFDPLNNQGLTNAALLDSQGTIMIAMEPKLVGLNVLHDMPAGTAADLEKYITEGRTGSIVIPEATMYHDVSFPPRITAFEKVTKDFAAKPAADAGNWVVMISSPLADTEQLVNGIFKSVIYWGIFVGVSMTGLFFSSSFFLIRSRIRYERQRSDLLTRELTQARDIQMAWLPKADNSPKGLDVAAINLPASHISGDFYNWFELPNGKIAVAIGDVTGHGMSAAFLMSTSQLLVRTTLPRVMDPGKCMEEVNRQLCTQNFAGQFVTMLLMVLDPEQGTIEIAAAGHPAPLVANQSAFRQLDIETQLVLGVETATRYPTQAYVLHPGSTLLLYTDGVVEAEGATGAQYQTARLLASLSKDFVSARTIVETVVTSVRDFTGTVALNDDLTLVAVRMVPK